MALNPSELHVILVIMGCKPHPFIADVEYCNNTVQESVAKDVESVRKHGLLKLLPREAFREPCCAPATLSNVLQQHICWVEMNRCKHTSSAGRHEGNDFYVLLTKVLGPIQKENDGMVALQSVK